MEDMPTARYMELLDKEEKREITPAEMQELQKIGGEWINEKTAQFQRQKPRMEECALPSHQQTPTWRR